MEYTKGAPTTHHHLAREHRLALATCGLFVALLVLVSGAPRALAHPASTARHATPPAAALRPPVPAPTTTTPPTTAPAPAAMPTPMMPGQEATVEIPSLGISLPVVSGGQDVIDRGVAAHYEGKNLRPPIGPGQPGTYWLAAHNATHGAPFGNLHAVANGAEVRIIGQDGTVFTYRITSRDLVGTTTTLATVYGVDATVPSILLQTCEGAAQRLLVHGVLTSVTAD
jgi:LPXTG-site transpeptidase (sortase) family protein